MRPYQQLPSVEFAARRMALCLELRLDGCGLATRPGVIGEGSTVS